LDPNDERQDREIEELQKTTKRFELLEAQLKFVKKVLAATVASIIGLIGTRIQKWDDIQVDLTELEGKQEAHEREAVQIAKHLTEQLDACHDDLRELAKQNREDHSPKTKR
jgi:hypothetical protein